MTTTTTDRVFIYGPYMSSSNAMEAYAERVFGERRLIGCTVLHPDGVQFQLQNGRRWYRVTVADNYQGWNVEVASEA